MAELQQVIQEVALDQDQLAEIIILPTIEIVGKLRVLILLREVRIHRDQILHVQEPQALALPEVAIKVVTGAVTINQDAVEGDKIE